RYVSKPQRSGRETGQIACERSHSPGGQLAAAGRNHLHMGSLPGLGGATKRRDSLTQTTTETVGQWYEFAPETGRVSRQLTPTRRYPVAPPAPPLLCSRSNRCRRSRPVAASLLD